MQFAGRLVDNAQLRETKTGKKVTGFTVAINDNYRSRNGEKMQKTTYVDCSLWNRPNITPHLKKGKVVELTGFATTGAYTNRKGEAVGKIEFRVDNVDFLGGGKDTAPAPPAPVTVTENGADDDLPF